MKVGIVGANSQVATELCVLLENERNVTPIPIVRSQLATHFLRHRGFECRIGDVSDQQDASEVLTGLDVVVIAAFAWQFSHEGFQSRQARKTNQRLVKHSIEHSPSDARIIYFSSQAAFGDDLGAPQYSDWSLYTQEKRNAERTLSEWCDELGKAGYALRLGFVYGRNQDSSKSLRRDLSAYERITVAADPNKPSNVIHTVTLEEAIVRCGTEEAPPGTYSLVNVPQWTWREVIEYYKPDDVVVSYAPPPDDRNALDDLLGWAWNFIEARERTLRTFTVYFPDWMNRRLFYEYLKNQRGNEISSLNEKTRIDMDAFRFDPISGPFLDGLTDTKQLLDEEDARLSDVFEVE